ASRGSAARRLALDLDGTPFQMKVWNRLCAIPSGKTVSYGALAAAIGRPRAARAVGAAVGANPVPLLVPCHRVIGENGSLTGFGLGLPMKRALLAHEGYTTK
ncbi:MAG: methylated-DNA--[protein]-cysteine S-methyltransferase, partial [Candidatus Eisenbacteria bacterium]